MTFVTLPVIEAGPLADAFVAMLDVHRDLPARLWARDHRLWREDPTEIVDRLGWLDAPERFQDRVAEFEAIAAEVEDAGYRQVVVVGMGGSSLFPDVLSATFPPHRLRLAVLDSTHPAAVQRVLDLPVDETLFVIASKSGSTLETLSHLEGIWAARAAVLDDPGRAFVAITDPGSDLERLARERGFRAVVLNDPDVGGRFSALTAFGLLPAAFVGVQLDELLDCAIAEVASARVLDGEVAVAFRLGVLIAVAAQHGRDKVTIVLPEAIAPFGAWIEQLVAESLGKDGISVVPLVDDREPAVPASDDRIYVSYGPSATVENLAASGHPIVALGDAGPIDLGALVVQWEVATAVAGAVLGVHPFDQPDVASAKAAAAAVLDAGLSEVARTPLDEALGVVAPGDLVAITAFVDPGGAAAGRLEAVRRAVQERTGAATTLGIGPRYLHSTGQLHKGGSNRIVVLQVLEFGDLDIDIPGRDFTFGTLLAAQAEGDLAALRDRGRRAFRVDLGELLGLAP